MIGLYVLLFGQLLSPLAHAGNPCPAPKFGWLPQGPVLSLRPVLESCREVDQDRTWIAIRRFRKSGQAFHWLVDPDTLATEAVPDECLVCSRTTAAELSKTRYLQALDAATVPQVKDSVIQNSGIIHAVEKVPGYFLTIDLCPSRKRGFDQEIFLALEQLKSQAQKPLPVAISISGAWLLRHEDSFEWLLTQEREGALQITWVNHTLTHPFSPELPLAHNFLLESGVHLDREVLGLEKLLLERGIVPSAYFRFPGLVSKASLLEKLRNYLLIPIGSDAWLAKNEAPTAGGIILIHGNLNEPVGVVDFLRWLSGAGNHAQFLGLSQLF